MAKGYNALSFAKAVLPIIMLPTSGYITMEGQATEAAKKNIICWAMTNNPNDSSHGRNATIYLSNAFDASDTAALSSPAYFAAYVASRDSNAKQANCVPSVMKQQFLAMYQNQSAPTGVSFKFVETGWQYTGPSAPSVTSKPAIVNAATPQTQNGSATGSGTGLSSIGSGLAATGQQMQQSTMQSVNQASQNVQSSAAATVSSTVDAATQKMTSALQNGMTGLFNRKKAAPAANVANTNVPAPPANRPETTSSVLPASYGLPPATVVPANAPANPAPMPSAKPSIQEEGDGKHWMLTIPGDPETHELTPVVNSKTVFIEDSTGDKYILMPDGDVKHIPHKNVAK